MDLLEAKQRVAEALGMDLPEALPPATASPVASEVRHSPALSLAARPGDGGIRTRKVAILVADGAEGEGIAAVVTTLVEQGAVPRLVGARLGACVAAGGQKFEADATLENTPGFLFDALVLPDGLQAVEALAADGHTMDFIKDCYRHCKTILALGAAGSLLAQAGVPDTLPDGSADPGLIRAAAADPKAAAGATADFIAALGKHRHYARETDPPVV